MNYIDISDIEQLNITFCSLVGIKPIRVILINKDTQETRAYVSTSSLYRYPKGWENVQAISFELPKYPDFTKLENFYIILNIQWELFGSLGDQYVRQQDESFPVNYLYQKTKALQILKNYGGSDMFNEFCKRVQESEYTYELDLEETID